MFQNKNLGQHWMKDASFVERIVASQAGIKDKTVLEIGPGSGILTKKILQAGCKKLICIEKDTRCLELLKKIELQFDNIEIINNNVLYCDLKSFAKDNKIILISNLPYNISKPILKRLIQISDIFESVTLVVQKEVAQRVTAQPNSKNYGYLSIFLDIYYEREMLFDIPPEAFVPAPKVMSSAIKLTPHKNPAITDQERESLEKLVNVIFSIRRKQIKNSLEKITPDALGVLKNAEIDPKTRPENLSLEELMRLNREVKVSESV